MALQKGNEQGCGPRMRKADAVPYLLQANNEIPWFDSQCFRNLISDEVHVKVMNFVLLNPCTIKT